jgi:hypothetical protein
MNTHSTWDDLQIHAYVDGELDAQLAARLEADSRADAILAARIARQRGLRQRLQSQFDPVLEEPVPQRLRDAMAGNLPAAEVIPFDAARRARVSVQRPAWSPREWGAIAATLLLGTLLGATLFGTSGGLPIETARGRLVASGELDTALSTQLSGSAPGSATQVGLSFRAADGRYCRTFGLPAGQAGLACRRDGRWAVQLLDDSGTNQAQAGNYRQAGSTLPSALLGAIDALGAGEPLTPEQEQQQVRAGWEGAAP